MKNEINLFLSDVLFLYPWKPLKTVRIFDAFMGYTKIFFGNVVKYNFYIFFLEI